MQKESIYFEAYRCSGSSRKYYIITRWCANQIVWWPRIAREHIIASRSSYSRNEWLWYFMRCSLFTLSVVNRWVYLLFVDLGGGGKSSVSHSAECNEGKPFVGDLKGCCRTDADVTISGWGAVSSVWDAGTFSSVSAKDTDCNNCGNELTEFSEGQAHSTVTRESLL